jgi:ribosomal protein S18 acetylase RimI-like enzyme
MSFIVRDLKNKDDWDFFYDLEFQSFITTVKDADQFSEKDLRQKYKEFNETDPINPLDSNHKIFIVWRDNVVRAGLIWLCNREPFWRFKYQHVWIYNLHILPQFRKQGLAKKLLLKAEEWCINQGLNILGLHVLDHNIAARRLYEQLNYELIETHNKSCFYEKKL